MGPRPYTASLAPAKCHPAPVVIERRALPGPDRPKLRPKPDAAAQLREIAAAMQHLPRPCLYDPAELVMLMRRLAGRLVVIADSGMEQAPSNRVRAPRQPFLVESRPDARAVAEALFRKAGGRSTSVGQVLSRKGRTVRVEVRRARAAGQYELRV